MLLGGYYLKAFPKINVLACLEYILEQNGWLAPAYFALSHFCKEGF